MNKYFEVNKEMDTFVGRAFVHYCNEARPKERSDRGRFLGVPGPFLKSFDSCIYKGASRRAALAARRFFRRLHAMSSAVVVFAI